LVEADEILKCTAGRFQIFKPSHGNMNTQWVNAVSYQDGRSVKSFNVPYIINSPVEEGDGAERSKGTRLVGKPTSKRAKKARIAIRKSPRTEGGTGTYASRRPAGMSRAC